MPGFTLIAMLHAIFLFSYVSCEWVEIFQNHQARLPFRKGSITTGFTTEGYVYKNSSIFESHREKGVIDRISNMGRIRQVPNPSVKSPSLKTKPSIFKSENSTLKPDINAIVSVQLNPLTSSSFRNEPSSQIQDLSFSNNNTNTNILNSNFRNNLQDTSKSKATGSANRKIFIFNDYDEDERWIHVNNKEKLKSDENISKNVYNDENLTNRDDANLHLKRHNDNEHKNFGNHKRRTEVDKQWNNDVEIKRLPENKPKEHTTDKIQENTSQLPLTETRKTSNTKSYPDFNINEINKYKITKSDVNISKDIERNGQFSSHVPFEDVRQNLNSYGLLKAKPVADFDSTFTDLIDRLLKMIQKIASTISTNTRKGLKGKVNYLEDLRNTILAAIETRIEESWPDDSAPAPRRRPARAAHGRGHVEFPSSESALMTISFLTFAVFLIKLVLQVIHTYKSKAMMVTPAVVATVGRGAASFNNKN